MSLLTNTVHQWTKLRGSLPPFLVDGLRYLPTSILPAFLAIVSSAIFTRLFSPTTYGLLTLVSAVAGPLVTVLTESTGQPIGRFFSEYKATNQMELYRNVVSLLLLATLVMGLVLDGLAAGVIGIVGIPASFTLAILGGAMVSILVQSSSALLQPILSASFQIGVYRRVNTGIPLLGFTLTLGGILLFGRHISWLVWGPPLATIAFLPLILKSAGIGLRRIIGSVRHFPEIRSTVVRFLRFGAPMAPWFFAFSLLSIGDRYVIQAVQGTATVAIYGVSYTLATQGVGLVTGPYMTGCWPRILQQWAGPDRNLVRITLRQMTDLYLVIGVALVGTIAVIGHPLLQILVGTAFTNGYRILVPVAIGSVIAGVSILGHKSMELMERNGLMAWDAVIAAGINLALNIWAIPRWGFVAAGWTTLVSYFLYTALIWWQAKRLLPWDLPFGKIFLYIVEATVSWAMAHTLLIITHAFPLEAVVLGSLVFAGIYGGLALWTFQHTSRTVL